MRKIKLQQIVERGLSKGIKSIFLFSGFSPLGHGGRIVELGGGVLNDEELNGILKATTTRWQYETFTEQKEIDYSYTIEGLGRFRISAFLRNKHMGLVMRPIPQEIPRFENLGLPPILKKFINARCGLILITGPAGSGKSTTLASMIDLINQKQSLHIVTIEDPIEYVYKPKKSIISQREVGGDTQSFSSALKHVLRQDTDNRGTYCNACYKKYDKGR